MKLSSLPSRVLPLLAGCLTAFLIAGPRREAERPEEKQTPALPANAEQASFPPEKAADAGELNPEKQAAELWRLPVERQFSAWNDACARLMAEGKWREAGRLALLAPPLRGDDGKALYPLSDMMETLASTHPQEAAQWLESEIAGGDLRMRSALSELLRKWVSVDPAACLETARGMDAAKPFFPMMVMEVLRTDPSALSEEDLMRAIPEKEDPRRIIGMIGFSLAISDPARAMEWAKKLETPAQRSRAAVAIAKSAARENRPETWDLLGALKTPQHREDAAKMWGNKAWTSDVNGAVGKLAAIPDPALIPAAAGGMLDKAYASGFGQALELAEDLKSSGLVADSLERLVEKTRIPPEAWTEDGADERLAPLLKELGPERKRELYAAAVRLREGAKDK